MPRTLEPGILYVSEEYGTAAHLCPCGCGSKVRTPLGPTDWVLEETEKGPTLYPSIGNWQLPCKSHYLIIEGRVVWSIKWTTKQIAIGRRKEEEQSRKYYEKFNPKRGDGLFNFWRWLMRLVGR